MSSRDFVYVHNLNRFLGRVAILVALGAMVELARPLAWSVVLLASVYVLFSLLSAAGYLHAWLRYPGLPKSLLDQETENFPPSARPENFRWSRAKKEQSPFGWEDQKPSEPATGELLKSLWEALQNSQWDKALVWAEKLVHARPEDAFGYAAMAWSLNQLGRHREALQPAQKACELAPEDPIGHAALAWAWGGTGRFDLALEPARKVASLRQQEALAWEMLVWILGNLGQYSEAANAARQALRLRPGWPTAHYNLGLALLKTGDWEGAWEQCETLQKLDPQLAQQLMTELKHANRDWGF